jgi:hypothetical protein
MFPQHIITSDKNPAQPPPICPEVIWLRPNRSHYPLSIMHALLVRSPPRHRHLKPTLHKPRRHRAPHERPRSRTLRTLLNMPLGNDLQLLVLEYVRPENHLFLIVLDLNAAGLSAAGGRRVGEFERQRYARVVVPHLGCIDTVPVGRLVTAFEQVVDLGAVGAVLLVSVAASRKVSLKKPFSGCGVRLRCLMISWAGREFMSRGSYFLDAVAMVMGVLGVTGKA